MSTVNPLMVAPVQSNGYFGQQIYDMEMAAYQPLADLSAANNGALILGDKGKPSDNQAQVTQALWDDYKTNFAPYQYQLLEGMTTEHPEIVGQEVSKAQRMVKSAFNTAAQNKEVTMARYGMAPDAQTVGSLDRQTALGQSAALVGAANATRAHLKERDAALMTSGVPNVAGRSYGMTGG